MVVKNNIEYYISSFKDVYDCFSIQTNEIQTEFYTLMIEAFCENNTNNEIIVNDLSTFLIEFNKFLSEFHQYMDVRHYLLSSNNYLKKIFLQSNLYIDFRVPNQDKTLIELERKRLDNTLSFIKNTLDKIITLIFDEVDELKEFLTKYEFFSNFEDSISITVNLHLRNNNELYIKAKTNPFKKISLRRVQKFFALNQLENFIPFDWEIKRNLLKNDYTISFLKRIR